MGEAITGYNEKCDKGGSLHIVNTNYQQQICYMSRHDSSSPSPNPLGLELERGHTVLLFNIQILTLLDNLDFDFWGLI